MAIMLRNLLPALVIVLLAGAVADAQSSKPARPPSPVFVTRVIERDDIQETQRFVGTVAPLKRSVVGSAVDGRVIEFPADVGRYVAKGEPLAQLRIQTITLQIQAAEATLDLYREELAELENGTRPEEVAQAKARMNAAKATWDYEVSRHERSKDLFEQDAISSEELEQTRSAADRGEALYQEAKAAYDQAVNGPRAEEIAQQKARVRAQEEQVSFLEDRKAKYTVKSPFNGFVVTEHTEEGAWLNQGDLVAEVVFMDQVEIEASVLEKHIPYVKVGEEVPVEIPALPSSNFFGTVSAISPQGNTSTRTFPVKVLVKNIITDGVPTIKAGMLAQITLPTGSSQKQLLVPKDAVVLGGAVPMLWKLTPDPKNPEVASPTPVPVALGVSAENLIAVQPEAPLKAGDIIVLQGNERVIPGKPVKIAKEIDANEYRVSSGISIMPESTQTDAPGGSP